MYMDSCPLFMQQIYLTHNYEYSALSGIIFLVSCWIGTGHLFLHTTCKPDKNSCLKSTVKSLQNIMEGYSLQIVMNLIQKELVTAKSSWSYVTEFFLVAGKCRRFACLGVWRREISGVVTRPQTFWSSRDWQDCQGRWLGWIRQSQWWENYSEKYWIALAPCDLAYSAFLFRFLYTLRARDL